MKDERTWRDTKYREREFYSLPLPEQRRLLRLPEGVNPSYPSFFNMPKPILVPKPDSRREVKT